MKKQVHAYYSGRVQGIGFRYTAQDLARDSGICGWAKNLSDGRVEIVVEAEEEVLQDFLNRISQHFSRYIQDTAVQWQEARGESKDFSIKF